MWGIFETFSGGSDMEVFISYASYGKQAPVCLPVWQATLALLYVIFED